jgi:hypothetical protein
VRVGRLTLLEQLLSLLPDAARVDLLVDRAVRRAALERAVLIDERDDLLDGLFGGRVPVRQCQCLDLLHDLLGERLSPVLYGHRIASIIAITTIPSGITMVQPRHARCASTSVVDGKYGSAVSDVPDDETCVRLVVRQKSLGRYSYSLRHDGQRMTTFTAPPPGRRRA